MIVRSGGMGAYGDQQAAFNAQAAARATAPVVTNVWAGKPTTAVSPAPAAKPGSVIATMRVAQISPVLTSKATDLILRSALTPPTTAASSVLPTSGASIAPGSIDTGYTVIGQGDAAIMAEGDALAQQSAAAQAAAEQAANAAMWKRYLLWGGVGAGALLAGILLFRR